jgi:hypothetical protein
MPKRFDTTLPGAVHEYDIGAARGNFSGAFHRRIRSLAVAARLRKSRGSVKEESRLGKEESRLGKALIITPYNQKIRRVAAPMRKR